MSKIIGGTLVYEDAKKHDGYPDPQFAPSRKASVTLTFAVDDGDNEQVVLNHAQALAVGKVNEMIGAKDMIKLTETTAPAEKVVVPKTETAAEKKARIAAEKAAAVGAGKTKDDLAREAGLPVGDDDPLNGGAVVAPAKPAAPPKTTPKPAEDDISDLLGDTAPKVVTDAELGTAAQKKMEAMKDKAGWAPSKIRELVKEIVGAEEGKVSQLKDVPQAKRGDFLKRLEALT